MDPCTVCIIRRSGNDEARFTSEGTMELSGGKRRVVYSTEGDRSELLFDAERLFMKRRGDVTLDACFCRDEPKFLFGGFGRTGEIPLYDVDLVLSESEKSILIRLSYSLGPTGTALRFRLDISIEFSEEK